MFIRWSLLAVLLLTVLGPAASAHQVATIDRNDSPGPLDIVATQLTHPDSRLKLDVVTYEAWNDATLSSELNYVRFDLDRPDKLGVQRCIVVHLHPPEPPNEGPIAVQADAYKGCDAPLPYYKPVEASTSVVRSDQHSLTLYVDKNFLWKRPLRRLRFRAITSFEDANHPDCQPPDPTPPEHLFGTCYDETTWRRH